jgi:tRNA(adenine34) deaminase
MTTIRLDVDRIDTAGRNYPQQEELDRFFMRAALDEARRSAEMGEVPVGCVIVVADRIVARGGNRTESRQDPTSHAEMIAVRKATLRFGNWRLTDATVYSTLEPCPMCMGALVLARVQRLVFGAWDAKAGAAGSLYDLSRDPRLNHRIRVMNGVEEDESRKLLQSFFQDLRQKRRGEGH